jgi:multicomponent Na+:H+ antiporter subunit G
VIVQTVVAGILVVAGLFFLAVSGIGLIRLPDFYTRNHAVGKSETLGAMLLLCGLAIYNGLEITSAKLVIILLFIALANPTATHIVARAAFRSGLQPWAQKMKKARRNSEKDPLNECEKTKIVRVEKL